MMLHEPATVSTEIGFHLSTHTTSYFYATCSRYRDPLLNSLHIRVFSNCLIKFLRAITVLKRTAITRLMAGITCSGTPTTRLIVNLSTSRALSLLPIFRMWRTESFSMSAAHSIGREKRVSDYTDQFVE